MTTSLRILLSKRFEGDKSIALGFGRAHFFIAYKSSEKGSSCLSALKSSALAVGELKGKTH